MKYIWIGLLNIIPLFSLSQNSTKFLSANVATGKLDYRYKFLKDSFKENEPKASATITFIADSIIITEKSSEKEFTWHLEIIDKSDTVVNEEGIKNIEYSCLNQNKQAIIIGEYFTTTHDFYYIDKQERFVIRYRKALKL